MFHIVYKTVNKTTGRFYIGLHSTNDLNDNYLGSGVILKKAIKKYGRESFYKTYVKFRTREDAREFEELAVKEAVALYGRGCYNRNNGGTGACFGQDNHFYGKTHTNETRKIMSEKASKRVGNKNSFYGRVHTEETKQKIKEFHLGKGKFDRSYLMRVSKEKRLGWWVTPEGCFESLNDATMFVGIGKSTIRNRCNFPDKIVKPNYQIPEEFWGKTWREVGYYKLTWKDLGQE